VTPPALFQRRFRQGPFHRPAMAAIELSSGRIADQPWSTQNNNLNQPPYAKKITKRLPQVSVKNGAAHGPPAQLRGSSRLAPVRRPACEAGRLSPIGIDDPAPIASGWAVCSGARKKRPPARGADDDPLPIGSAALDAGSNSRP